MATEEKKANERKAQANQRAGIEDVITCLIDKTSGERCLIEHLVLNHHAPHARLSSVMRRLLNKAQRVSSSFAHAPQLAVTESSKFQLCIPMFLQTKILKRALSAHASLRSMWTLFSNAVDWLTPLGFIARNCYFHASVESQVDEFLHAKCVQASAKMSDEVARSLKLQMEEFMSPAHSVTLSEFMCVSTFLLLCMCSTLSGCLTYLYW
jgi:hypothetical protein